MVITARDWKILTWIVLVLGTLLTAGGIFGGWLQGKFYERGFPTAATLEEVRSAFTWPTMFTTLGSLIVTGVILVSPLTTAWTSRRRLIVFVCFGVFVVVASVVCGHIAGGRVAGILN